MSLPSPNSSKNPDTTPSWRGNGISASNQNTLPNRAVSRNPSPFSLAVQTITAGNRNSIIQMTSPASSKQQSQHSIWKETNTSANFQKISTPATVTQTK